MLENTGSELKDEKLLDSSLYTYIYTHMYTYT